MADLLSWTPARYEPRAWREAFDRHLESRISVVLGQSESDDCLEAGVALLADNARRRFLSAPAVATMLRCYLDNQFDSRLFAQLLLAELADAGLATELPETLWTARGDRLLDRQPSDGWAPAGTRLLDAGIDVDIASPFAFPDDEFGIAETTPHDTVEVEIVLHKVRAAIGALRQACPPALALVTSFIEVLALRREPAGATAFHSSTFPGCPGLVRFTNAHLPEAGTEMIIEALVHEAIHCILHVHEELEEPFVSEMKASHAKMTSPWTGDTIRLQSYVHACAVWYGIYWLWSADGFASSNRIVDFMRQRAHSGFRHCPVSVGLAPFSHLLTRDIKTLLRELEERMLKVA
jgi:hypothetical protein